MAMLSASGVNVFTRVSAMTAFVFLRCWMSPAWRCEKNSMGMRSTCHMNVDDPMTAILPLIFSE